MAEAWIYHLFSKVPTPAPKSVEEQKVGWEPVNMSSLLSLV